MKKSNKKQLADFLPQQIQNTKTIKGGDGGNEDDPCTEDVIGTTDITDG